MQFGSEIEGDHHDRDPLDGDVDFGNLIITLDGDDDVQFTVMGGVTSILLPLWNRQAKELVEVAQRIAKLKDLT